MKRACALMLTLLLLTGCSARRTQAPQPTPAPQPQPAPAAEVTTPAALPARGAQNQPLPAPEPAARGLLGLTDPTMLTMDELRTQLEADLNEAGEAPDVRLRQIIARWYVPQQPNAASADLDGDGQLEYVVAFRMGGTRPVNGAGALFIIYRNDARWRVERSPGEEVNGVGLYDLADLTGDGRPEIIWGESNAGAHTAHFAIYVSDWAPGRLERLPGEISMASMQFRREGADLVLTGGLIGSAGAGPQREWSDRYRWTGAKFELVDRRWTAGDADWGYWRLIDGTTHERFGRPAEAEQAYRAALDPARPAADAGAVKPEWTEKYPEAVRTAARLRLIRLLTVQERFQDAQALTRDATGPYAEVIRATALSSSLTGVCPIAASWAASRTDMIPALNGLFGYANEVWSQQNLCGTPF